MKGQQHRYFGNQLRHSGSIRQCQEMVQRHEEERRRPAPSLLCSLCPGNGWCRFARPSHQCLSHWNLEQEMVVGVVYLHAQYLHGKCLAAVFVSKSRGSHGFTKLHEACDSSLFAGTRTWRSTCCYFRSSPPEHQEGTMGTFSTEASQQAPIPSLT